MRGGVTPDPKMHMSSGSRRDRLAAGHGGGDNWYERFHETTLGKAQFRDLKNDLNSPMCMPGIIKESPRPSYLHHQNSGNFNININIDYTG